MPDHRLKPFGMRGDHFLIDSGDDHAGIGDLGGVPTVSSYDPTDTGPHALCVLQGSNQVRTDVAL